MNEWLDLTGQSGAAGIAIIVIFVLAIGVLAYFKLKKKGKKVEAIETSSSLVSEAEKGEGENVETVTRILGTGKYKCMAIRPGQILDFTTMPEPVGEIYQADTSCPTHGGHYIVQEKEDGSVVDYDPRQVPIVRKQTPEDAWLAVDWQICRRFWTVPLQWWKTPANWFAAGMMIIVFILGLAVMG